MITKEEYLEAKKIVDKYKSEQLHKQSNIEIVVIREDCPDGYWYSNQKREQLNVKSCCYSDLRDVEGFSDKEPEDCWKVADGESAGNVIEKKHCLSISK